MLSFSLQEKTTSNTLKNNNLLNVKFFIILFIELQSLL